MPAMFSEADLEAFQRLRCAFDPYGLANPGKVMPTPRLCGEVPAPTASIRSSARASRRGSKPMPRRTRASHDVRGGRRRAGRRGRRAAAPCGSSAAARSSAGARRPPSLQLVLRTTAARPDRRAQRRRPDRRAPGWRAAGARPGGRSRATGQMLALDPPLGDADKGAEATIGGVFATADSRARCATATALRAT